MIQIERVISKLDEYYARNDMPGAERHLDYWLAEAEMSRDVKGQITVLSELAGLCRMMGKGEKALSCAGKVLTLIEECGLDSTISGATILINCATVYAAFGKDEASLPLFGKALSVYGASLPEGDELFGSLYNNYAAALKDLGRYDDALSMYEKALTIMGSVPDGQCEQAVTYLNMAGVIEARDGLWDGCEVIEEYVGKAEELLDSEALTHDVHYALTCSKCIPVFSYHGFFAFAEELKRRAEEIYARN